MITGALLSEAITNGSTLRPEAPHNAFGDRFCWVEGEHGGLRSDPWGAACEAVQPAVARFNWRDKHAYERSMDAFRAVQHQYFDRYFQMPAQCPGSQQRFIAMGGRVVSNRGEGQIKVYDEGQTTGNLGAVTSECDLVQQMAGMVDHLYYAHGWSREKVAEAVLWYEQRRTASYIAMNFSHNSVNAEKYVRTLVRSNARD